MSLRLPPAASPVRELFAMEQLASLANPHAVRCLPTYWEGIRAARASLALEPAARDVHVLILRADDELWLIRVSRRTQTAERVWNFGQLQW